MVLDTGLHSTWDIQTGREGGDYLGREAGKACSYRVIHIPRVLWGKDVHSQGPMAGALPGLAQQSHLEQTEIFRRKKLTDLLVTHTWLGLAAHSKASLQVVVKESAAFIAGSPD